MESIWGSVADWVTAIVALLALGSAVWAAVISRRLVKVELARDVKAAEREVREQAAGVAAWAVGSDERSVRGLQIHNSSDAPVYDVTVESTYSPAKNQAGEPEPPLRMSVLPPGDFIALKATQFPWSFPDPVENIGHSMRPVMSNPRWCVTRVRFVDGQGVAWVREGGDLTRA